MLSTINSTSHAVSIFVRVLCIENRKKMFIAQVCSTAAILADLVHNRRREELHHRFPGASRSSWRREQRDQEVGE